MHKLTTPLALVAMAAALASVSPALAQNNSVPKTGIDCKLPVNATNPACLPTKGGRHDTHRGGQTGSGSNSHNGSANDQQSPGNASDSSHVGPLSNNHDSGGNNNNNHSNSNNNDHNFNGGPNHGPQNGSFNWSRHDRDQFHQRFRGFNFGFFGVPNFSIHIGTAVPRSFNLRPVPRAIYRDYPWFRGYLFFVTRGGDIVIVSPRSHRIVGII